MADQADTAMAARARYQQELLDKDFVAEVVVANIIQAVAVAPAPRVQMQQLLHMAALEYITISQVLGIIGVVVVVVPPTH